MQGIAHGLGLDMQLLSGMIQMVGLNCSLLRLGLRLSLHTRYEAFDSSMGAGGEGRYNDAA